MSPDTPVDDDPATTRWTSWIRPKSSRRSSRRSSSTPRSSTRRRLTGAKRPNVFLRLYRGETSFDFIGNRKWWFGISAIIIVIGIISLSTRGLNEGIDFKGGQSWLVSSQTMTVAQATTVAKAAGVPSPTVVQLTNQLNGQKQIQVTADLGTGTTSEQQAQLLAVQQALAKAAHVDENAVSVNQVGATWGSNVTDKAIQALIIFFIVVYAVHLAAFRTEDGGRPPWWRYSTTSWS